ncbi:hypothetical protein MY3957_009992, partial [Beauveria namnaoensis]
MSLAKTDVYTRYLDSDTRLLAENLPSLEKKARL